MSKVLFLKFEDVQREKKTHHLFFEVSWKVLGVVP